MASDTPNVQLGNLDFAGIKDSIKSYLETQDVIKDYDYAGSAMQVLLDVLAYNTMYYGYYTNMVANEMFLDSAQRLESIISLVKPLGYVVPGKTSAKGKAKVRHGGDISTTIPAYTRFSGSNEDGTPYTFYTIQEYFLNQDGEAIVDIHESKSLTRELPLIVDLKTQKSFLLGLDIDIRTITIEVKNPVTDIWDKWAIANNIESGLDETSKVYWLERSELGFFVVFGGNIGSGTTVQVGKQITSNDLVRVTYLKSSGKLGDGVGSFKVHGIETAAETETHAMSSGGTDEPNLDMIRFFAPKWFAAQDRAVTVEDCRALLAQYGFVGDSIDPLEAFNVWGGEEMNPPMYGRVFVSVNIEPDDILEQAILAETIPALLKEKTCVTILPEFMSPEFFDVIVSGNVHWDPMKTVNSREQIMSTIIQNVTDNFPRRFGNSYNTTQVSDTINAVDPNAIFTVGSDFSYSVKTRVYLGADLNTKKIHFRNKLNGSFITSSFTVGSKWSGSLQNPNQQIRIRPIGGFDKNGMQKLQGYYSNQNNVTSVLNYAGKWHPESGECYINKGVAAEPFDITCVPVNHIFDAKHNMVSRLFLNLQLQRTGT